MTLPPCPTCPTEHNCGGWKRKACFRLAELSKPARSFSQLCVQWFHTNDVDDFGEDEFGDHIPIQEWPNCELCGHESIRWGYHITNLLNENKLIIGSKCITRFDILKPHEAKQAVKKVISGQKDIRVICALSHLNDHLSWIRYYNDNGAFTPKQVSTIFSVLDRKGVRYNRQDFTVKIRRERERRQLKKHWQEMYDILSTSQKRFLNENVPGGAA